jgi:hypothetical protein
MTSPSITTLKCPVRVLIRTSPAQLGKIHPSLFQADSHLIKRLCAQLSSNEETTEIHHLITKLSNRRGSECEEIVFDYGVPADEYQPAVVAFNVKVAGSTLTIQQLCSPLLRRKVNERVEIWRKINLKNGFAFPSQTDVRKNQYVSHRGLSPPTTQADVSKATTQTESTKMRKL